MQAISSGKTQTGWLKPKGRAWAWGFITCLALTQTGAALNWPVFSWLQDHKPRVVVTAEQPASTEQVQP